MRVSENGVKERMKGGEWGERVKDRGRVIH